MHAGSHVVPGISGSFLEVDAPPGFVPRPQIGRLRWLMLAFEKTYVVSGTGRFVAFRLDIDAGLAPRPIVGVTMLNVYESALSIGLIAIVGDREVPSPAFVARAKALSVARCHTCGVGEYLSAPDVHDPCWVCLARREQAEVRAVYGSVGDVRCRR